MDAEPFSEPTKQIKLDFSQAGKPLALQIADC
jgi:hypothetical protein